MLPNHLIYFAFRVMYICEFWRCKMSELREKLYKICEETNTSRSGMDYLVDYYIKSLGWSEEEAVKYAIGLFKNGTIREIKLIGKDGKEL